MVRGATSLVSFILLSFIHSFLRQNIYRQVPASISKFKMLFAFLKGHISYLNFLNSTVWLILTATRVPALSWRSSHGKWIITVTVKPRDIKVALYGCVGCVLFKSRGTMLGLLCERWGHGRNSTHRPGEHGILGWRCSLLRGHKTFNAPKHILKLTAYLCRWNIYFHNIF